MSPTSWCVRTWWNNSIVPGRVLLLNGTSKKAPSSHHQGLYSYCFDFSDPIISIIEPCLHEISYKDICAICGTDLSV